MGEWLSYRLSDLLMFTPEVYFRLFERYNGALWPVQLPALLMGVWFIVATRNAGSRPSRWLLLLLGAVWLFIAWAFFLGLYAEIFLAAPWFAAGFALQGLLLIVAGGPGRLRLAWHGGAVEYTGAALLLYAVVGHPLVGVFGGREWSGIELFLLAPDPTAIGTLGLLSMISSPGRWGLALLPLLWCLISGATLWVMEAPLGLLTPIAALVAVVAMACRSFQRGGGSSILLR